MKMSIAIIGLLAVLLGLFSLGFFGESIESQADHELNLSITNQTALYDKINSTSSSIKESLVKISEERENGFLNVIAEGLYALPNILIQLPLLILTLLTSSTTSLITILFGISVHPMIIAILISIITIWAIFKLVSYFTSKEI